MTALWVVIILQFVIEVVTVFCWRRDVKQAERRITDCERANKRLLELGKN